MWVGHAAAAAWAVPGAPPWAGRGHPLREPLALGSQELPPAAPPGFALEKTVRWGFRALDLTHVRRSLAPSPLQATRRGHPWGGWGGGRPSQVPGLHEQVPLLHLGCPPLGPGVRQVQVGILALLPVALGTLGLVPLCL